MQLTIDEELDLLDSSLRRLKIEYDIYFGGGSKKPPNDTLWRVNSLIKKYSDSQKLNFSQRYKFNYSDATICHLQRSLAAKAENQGRGLPATPGRGARHHGSAHGSWNARRRLRWARLQRPNLQDRLQRRGPRYGHGARLLRPHDGEKQKVGETAGAPFESFASFLKKKTEQIRKDFKCEAVEYSLEVQDRQVKLKAKPKTV